jgi:tetratricopeptide (TPR) repeat protein
MTARTRTLAALALTVALAVSPVAHAEPEPARPPADVAPAAPPASPTAPSKDPLTAPLPDGPAERAKLLSNLYAYLATAGNAEEAQPIAVTIERLWLLNDSDTIAYLMERAGRALTEKNTDLALRFLDQVVDLAPDYAEGWNRRAYAHFISGDVERALGDLRRCLALEPAHFRALEAVASIFRERGQDAAALKVMKKLSEVHPNMPGLENGLQELTRKVEGQRT